jgi:hypothetical protein
MSYLVLSNGIPDFSKAVISLWFRVPQATIDAATAAYSEAITPRPRFNGIIPLIVFGPSFKTKRFHFPMVLLGGGYTEVFQTYTTRCQYETTGTSLVQYSGSQWKFTGEEYDDIDPSYIGIDCSRAWDVDKPLLSVNIQMQDFATLKGAWPIATKTTGPDTLIRQGKPNPYSGCTIPPTKPNGSLVPTRDVTFTTAYGSGASVVMGARPEVFRTLNARPGQLAFQEIDTQPDTPLGQEVTPDKWHHLLLSLDFSLDCTTQGLRLPSGSPIPPQGTQGARTTSACKMWLAYDDVNLVEKNLSCYWPTGHSDPNFLLTQNAYYIASSRTFPTSQTSDDDFGNLITVTNTYDVPSCDYVPAQIPASAYPLGLPGTNVYSSKVLNCEMAELQIFTGVTLETGNVNNRRAFIAAEKKADDTPTGFLVPAKPESAERLMGKRPAILLHGQDNWIKGKNTGSLGKDGAGEIIPSGQFHPTGRIVKYKPDPKITAGAAAAMMSPRIEMTADVRQSG